MVEILAYCAAGLAALAALYVILSPDILRAALGLIVVLLALAGVYACLGAYFLAAVQVIVYAGAIMVLFLFAIMVLKSRREPAAETAGAGLYRLAAWLVGAVLFGGLAAAGGVSLGGGMRKLAGGHAATRELVQTLFREYVLAFELVGVLLFVTLVAVMVLAAKDKAS